MLEWLPLAYALHWLHQRDKRMVQAVQPAPPVSYTYVPTVIVQVLVLPGLRANPADRWRD